MECDSSSSTTSVDDNTENYCDNPTRDTLVDGIMSLLKPSVDALDERLKSAQVSQIELKRVIDTLHVELDKIGELQQSSVNLDDSVKKLLNAKQRITVVANILQNAQERLNRIHSSIEKETIKRKTLLDSSVRPSEEY